MSHGEERSARVLVADEEPEVVEALRIVLRSEACVMHTVTSVSALVQAVTEGEFDVALVDMRFAGSPSSLDTLAQLRAIDPTLPIIVMSAWSNVERAVDAVRRGAREYIQKPWDTARLVTTLRREIEVGAALRRSRRLETETSRLRALALPKLIAHSPAMAPVLRHLDVAASSSSNVLVSGERGTGKRAIARWIHAMSDRAARPLVSVDPARSSDIDLFGQARGGPDQPDRVGCVELAHGGALLVEEIATLSSAQQAKLLAVCKTGSVRAVGASRVRAADIRILATSSVDLAVEVEEGRFLRELLERIRAVEVDIPPLRVRLDDLPSLAQHFLEKAAGPRAPAVSFTENAGKALREYAWPGNVRELELVVERALVASRGHDICAADLGLLPGAPAASPPGDVVTLEEVERIAIRRALVHAGGNVVRAAATLGLSRSAMYRRLQTYGIRATGESV